MRLLTMLGLRRGPATPLSLPLSLPLLLLLLLVCRPADALCPDQCRCRAHVSDCSSARLSSVPISLDPRIHVLQLSDNAISSIADTLVFYPQLRQLDLANNTLTELGERQLIVQQQLHRLQLAGNQLQRLSRGALHGLGRLARLDLSGNHLTELEERVFEPAPRLRHLLLARNRLSDISGDVLLGLGELEVLDLSGNALTHVPSAAFRHLGRLHTLLLGGNRLTQVAMHAFFSLRSMRTLSLAGNVIAEIHTEAFAELPELRRLDVSGNLLDAFPSPALAPLRLEELDAGGNLFTALQPRHLDGLPHLRTLRLCGSRHLETVSAHCFSNNRHLQQVHVCENPRLAYLPPTAVTELRHLRLLNIGGNGLAMLENMTALLQQVQVFNVSGNPLVCNCSALWLWELPQRVPNASAVSEVHCAGSGRVLASLSQHELGCRWWVTAAVAAAVSLLVAVCAALAVVVWVRRRRCRDRSRSSTQHAPAAEQKVLPRLVPPAPAKGAQPAAAGTHSTHLTLLSGDYVTDVGRGDYRSDVGRGDYGADVGRGDYGDHGDYARVYDSAYVRNYSGNTSSVVV